MNYDGAVIAGAAETAYHKKPESGPLRYILQAVRDAVNDAGLRPDMIDGLAVSSFQLAPDNAVTVAEHLGLELRWAYAGIHGGASGIVSILEAVRAIQAGDCHAVVCCAGDAFTVKGHMDIIGEFSGPIRDYVDPHGFGGTNGMFALVEQKHRALYGTSKEALGKLAVTQRGHAALNPNALLRSPMTTDDYLNSRPIADPICLFDCVMPCAGAEAVVVVAEDLVDASRPSVRILAGGQCHAYGIDDPVMTDAGWIRYSRAMFSQANLSHEDIDVLELYDDYPIMLAIQLEDLGFCVKGEAGPFILSNDFSITGNLPLNTGGGQLSCGQCGAGGGMIGVVEAYNQLVGRAGARQVAEARRALVSGFGMVSYGRGLSTSAAILESVL